MDCDSEAAEAFRKQQSLFAAQMHANDASLQAETEPFEDLEWRYNQASGALISSLKNGGVSPEEQKFFDQIQEQYEKAKAKRKELENLKTETSLDSNKRRRASYSPMFVQQNEPDQDEGYDLINTSPGSKRKRGKTPEDPPKSSRSVGMTETVKQSLRRLIADAPAEKKQTAIHDSARVLHAIKQFRPGSVKYLREDMWTVEGVVTPIKTHQLIHAGWMNEQEATARGPKGGILADKMGLGKTLCSLTSMVQGNSIVGPRGSKTNLVVVLKSLKDQWVLEAQKHTARPTFNAMIGLNQILSYSPEASFDTHMLTFKNADLVVVTYTELGSAFKNVIYPPDMEDDAEKESYFNEEIRPTLPAIFQFKFRAIYLDEGHEIRNVKTEKSKVCQKLLSKFRWILTGTPMTNDPTDLYSALTFIRHPKVLELTFTEFKARHKGGKGKNDPAGRRGKRGGNVKMVKKGKGSKSDQQEIDIEWVGTLLHESMRSWKHDDELFGHQLTTIPEPIIIDLSLKLSVPESVIYNVVYNRLSKLAQEKADDNYDDNEANLNLPGTHKLFVAAITVLRQMAGHVLLIRPDIFRCLTDEDMAEIDNKIHNSKTVQLSEPTETSPDQCFAESKETSLDPHANDYLIALRELQRGNTCVVCEQSAENPQWTVCNHAYCYSCLTNEMHLASAQDQKLQCKLCKLPVSQCIDEVEHEKRAKPRWLNKAGKVIPSTKSSAVVNKVKEWRDPITGIPQAKAVLFTTFKDSLKLLAATLKEEKLGFVTLTSDLSPAARNASVSRFKNDPKITILLATDGIGGTGLNLMNARYLINYDRYWNEAREMQARGRIHRIGQIEETTIVSLTAKGTFDERTNAIKDSKIDNIDKVMKSSSKKNVKALLKLFEKAKKNKEIVEWDEKDD